MIRILVFGEKNKNFPDVFQRDKKWAILASCMAILAIFR
jgi:hypothetical protein